ncbi:MAG: glycogen synthase [Spirochaetes bacterium]|nr:glycogen synthase [Spirochaetota bacterium]
MRQLKIAIISAEAAPFTQNNSLSEFSGSLPKYLAGKGHEIILIIPRYGTIDDKLVNSESCTGRLTVPFGFDEKYAAVRRSNSVTGIKTYFIEHNYYFDRSGLYGDEHGEFGDNAERFIFFSRAVIQALAALNFKPDIIHCNGWQTGLVPVYLKTIYKNDFNFFNTRTLFTVHNMKNQGIFSKDNIFFTQLGWESFNEDCLKFYDAINLLKAGLIYSDAISATSGKYSDEITHPEYGFELSGILRKRKSDLFGILNGADYSDMNPETDKLIAANYYSDNLNGKSICKKDLQRELKLPQKPMTPLLCSVAESNEDKGMDQFASVLGNILTANHNLQFVLPVSGNSQITSRYTAIQKHYPENIAFFNRKDIKLLHKVHAGSDIHILPSGYQPECSDLIAGMKYGTVPAVNDAGASDDAVENWNPELKTGNGFKFHSTESMPLLQSINNILNEFENRDNWNILMKNAMAYRNSWENTAEKYEKIYDILVKNRYNH